MEAVWDIAWVSKEVGLELINNIYIDTISAKINQEEDIWNIKMPIAIGILKYYQT